jgi:hypothetical protein
MPRWSIPPPIFDTRDNSGAAAGNWLTSALLRGRSTSQPSSDDTNGSQVPLAPNGQDFKTTAPSDPGDIFDPLALPSQSSEGPLSLNDAYLEYLKRLHAGQSPALTFDSNAPGVPRSSSPIAQMADDDGPLTFTEAYLQYRKRLDAGQPQSFSSGAASDDSTFSGNPDFPTTRMPLNYGRSALPSGPPPTSTQASAATPAFAPDAVYSPMGNFFGNFPRTSGATAAPVASDTYRSGLATARADFGAPAAGFSQLMSAGPFAGNSPFFPAAGVARSAAPPWQTPSGNPTQAAPPLQPNATPDAIDEPPVRRLGRRTYSLSQGSAFDDTAMQSPAAPQGPLTLNEAYLEYRRRLDASQSPASAFEPSAPAVTQPIVNCSGAGRRWTNDAHESLSAISQAARRQPAAVACSRR